MQSKLGYLLSGPLTQYQTQFSGGSILHVTAAYQEENQHQTNFWNMEPTDTTGSKNSDSDFFLQYQNSCI